jgi:hypothetical protein
MLHKLLLVLLSFCLITSCKQSTETTAIKVEDASHIIVNTYPTLPPEFQNNIFTNCTYLDYIFNDLPFSVSQNDRTGIMTNVGFIGSEVPTHINKNCKSLGREMFQINGEIVLEAEIFFTAECNYYLFYVDGKPKYSNVISKSGIDFYRNLIINAEQLRKNPNINQ